MKEIIDMKEYDVEIEEVLRKVVRVRANDISDAIDIVSDKINSCDIVLTADDYSGERNIRNYNSRDLDEKLNFYMRYDSKDGILTIFHNDNKEAKYVCDTVRDLKNCLNTYIENYIDDSEKEAIKEEMDLEEIER